MNKALLMRAVMETVLFFGMCDDDDVHPDTAVSQFEGISATLNGLSDAERAKKTCPSFEAPARRRELFAFYPDEFVTRSPTPSSARDSARRPVLESSTHGPSVNGLAPLVAERRRTLRVNDVQTEPLSRFDVRINTDRPIETPDANGIVGGG